MKLSDTVSKVAFKDCYLPIKILYAGKPMVSSSFEDMVQHLNREDFKENLISE